MQLLSYSRGGSGQPLIIMHGLFGSSRNWQTLARALSADHEVFNVDLRNHGQSFHADEMNYEVMAADLAALLEQLGLADCDLLGHSMGGKVAMALALTRPRLVARMVIADIAPVAYFHHYDDLIEPILALPLATLESRAQAEQLLRQNIPEDQLRAFLLQNLQRSGDSWQWRVNWRVIQRDMEWLTGFVDLPQDWRIEKPTLFLRGDRSDYIGEAEIEVIEAHFDAAEIATVEDAGHWLHAEQPQRFSELVRGYLAA